MGDLCVGGGGSGVVVFVVGLINVDTVCEVMELVSRS